MTTDMVSSLTQALNWRYAVKKFDPQKKISDQEFKALQESLRLSPSSYGLQPWKFIVVNNPELRKKLRASSWNQSQVEDASHYVVLTYKEKMDEAHIEKYVQNMAATRGVTRDSLEPFYKVMVGDIVAGPRSQTIDAWAQRQCYIAMGFLMLSAASLNIDSCPMEGLVPEEYDALLDLKGSGYKTLASVALGYRHVDDKYQHMAKVRFATNEIFVTK